MRILKYSLVLVLLLVILAGIAPWADGFLFKRTYLALLTSAQTDLQGSLNIKVLEYKQGWLTSSVKIYVEPVLNRTRFSNPSKAVSQLRRAPVGFTIDQDIMHGPIVFDRTNNEWGIAQAVMKGYVHAPDVYEASLLGSKKNEGLVQINTLVNFQDDFISQIDMPVITIQDRSGKFSWQGIKGTIDAATSQGQVNAVKTDLKIGAISAEGVRGTFNTKEGTYQYDVTRQPVGLWNGTVNFSAPEMIFNYLNKENINQSSKLTGLAMSSVFGVNSASYSSSMQISMKQLQLPTYSISPASFKCSVNNLDAKGLAALVNMTKTLNTQQQMSREMMDQLNVLLPGLLTPTTSINADLAITTPTGRAIATSKVFWPANPVPHTLQEMAMKVQVEGNIRISVALVNEFIDIIAKQQQEKNNRLKALTSSTSGPAENLTTISPQTVDAFEKQIDTLTQQGQVTAFASVQLKDIGKMRLPVEAYTANIDRFVTMKEIKPEAAAQLKTVLQADKSSAVPVASQAAQQAVEQPAPEQTPADQMKNQINELIKLGYIVQEKDDYVIAFSYQEGVTKANGVVVKPSMQSEQNTAPLQQQPGQPQGAPPQEAAPQDQPPQQVSQQQLQQTAAPSVQSQPQQAEPKQQHQAASQQKLQAAPQQSQVH